MMNQLRTAPAPLNLFAAGALAAIALLATPALAQLPEESEPNAPYGSGDHIFQEDLTHPELWQADLPPGDQDWFVFTLPPGFSGRLSVATMTSASASSNTRLSVFSGDGTTLLEADEDNGTFGGLSSSIAGLPVTGPADYYIMVEGGSPTLQVAPYYLYVMLAQNPATAEIEPNNTTIGAQPFLTGGSIIGSTSSETDVDFYSVTANAGDTIYAALDLDPERDPAVDWNGVLRMEPFNGQALTVNDGGGGGGSPFDSEAMFMTVKDAGTYYIGVQGQAGGGSGTYRMYVAWGRFYEAVPLDFSSTTVPQTIPTGRSGIANTITVPENPLAGGPPLLVGKVTVSINLTHSNMPDLDVRLISPSGKSVALFTDIGVNILPTMNLVLDDEAAIPAGIYLVNAGMHYQLEGGKRLEWFAGEPAAGTWTLVINDDTAGNGGTLNNWSITIYEAPPRPPDCAEAIAGATGGRGSEVTIFSTDFESGAAGFTHSGLQDEWELGEPTVDPVVGCNSGANCWKTDLDGIYNSFSNQELISPAIDLDGVSGPIVAHWAQAYQMEGNLDRAYVEVREVGVPASARRLWTWGGPTMTASVGNPAILTQEHAGWQMVHADISDFAGEMIELRFHVDSDNVLSNFEGLAIDDVSVTACGAPCPGDVNGSGTVNVTDLLALIAVWGPGGGNGPADLDNSGTVNVTDLLALIANWGPC